MAQHAPTGDAEAQQNGIGPAALGARLRHHRRRAGLTLKQLGDAAELSESFLSQLERGKLSASVSSLRRIAATLGVTVSDLFEQVGDGQPVRVLRRHQRPVVSLGTLVRKSLLTPSGGDVEVFQIAFDVGGSTGEEAYAHGANDEFVLVMTGTFEATIAGETSLLGPGDNITFSSALPHRVANVGNTSGEVLWVNGPPSR